MVSCILVWLAFERQLSPFRLAICTQRTEAGWKSAGSGSSRRTFLAFVLLIEFSVRLLKCCLSCRLRWFSWFNVSFVLMIRLIEQNPQPRFERGMQDSNLHARSLAISPQPRGKKKVHYTGNLRGNSRDWGRRRTLTWRKTTKTGSIV